MFVEEKTQGEPTKVLDEASRLMLKAADLMELRGMAKYITCDRQGRLCVRGALLAAEGIAPLRESYSGSFLTYYWGEGGPAAMEADLRLAFALGGQEPHYWNNNPDRTVGEVVAKLRAVALGG